MLKSWQRVLRRRQEPSIASTHAARLERWLGTETTEQLSRNFRGWFGPPVPVGSVPGAVFVCGDGDFIGEYRGSRVVTALENAGEIFRREERRRFQRALGYQRGSFASLSALIAAATGGKTCRMPFSKTGAAPTAIYGAMDTWMEGPAPAAGAAGGALTSAPTVTTSATTGALPFVNAVVNANTSHFVNAWVEASAINVLLMVDQLFRGAYILSTGGAQTVLNSSAANWTHYQSTTATDPSYAGGTFAYPAVTGTLLAATAHNWHLCTYRNQANAATNTMPDIAGISACAKWQIDLLLQSWFVPLAAGDTGIFNLQGDNVQTSATVATGTVDWVVAHPITILPCPIAAVAQNIDGVASAFNLAIVYDNACLNFIELPKPATTATTYSGIITTVSE